jgi:two-component system sensor histidine kinase MprB
VSLRTRLTLAGGAAVFVALAIASLVIFVEVRSKLRDQIDVSLINTAQTLGIKGGFVPPVPKLPSGAYPKKNNPTFPHGPYLGSDGATEFQIIPSFRAVARNTAVDVISPATTGKILTETVPAGKPLTPVGAAPAPNGFVPLTKQDSAVAAGVAPPYFSDVTYHSTAMRLYTMRLPSSTDGLVRTARPLTEANATIARVRWLLIGLTLGGALAAALLGRLAAAAVLRPVRRLAVAVQDVTTTRDLNRRIDVDGADELASLASNFNAMLAALEESQRTQQQLIADASHELRTPLTAHRANVELLARPDLPAERRPHVLSAAVRGIEELSLLVGDLIQAARNGKSVDARAPVALHELVAAAVARAHRREPELRFETRLEPYTVSAAATRVERTLDNVLDNAVKWSPPAGTIEVVLSGGVVSVRDHGPGIEPDDLPHVLDRFYRAAAARGQPGSGLGLAIVKQTVDDHGGSVTVVNADDGGTLVTLRFD